jgi:exopolyphosphatase/guanosine-5'-triphosphate,3'-diphosphate pyrophosphatase
MSKRIAALDLGTNTFHLLIADVDGSDIRSIVFQEQRHVKLGEGISEGRITGASFSRGLEAVKYFHSIIIEKQVNIVHAVGTAALRAAENGSTFIDSVKQETDITIEIIAGDTEADLIYQGVRRAVNLDPVSLVMDIGGGSVEFIFADSKKALWKKSYPIGAAKLMSLFHKLDPIAQEEIEDIQTHLNATLVDFREAVKTYKPLILVGSAGAFETYAALSQLKCGLPIQAIEKCFNFDIPVLQSVLTDILNSRHAERAANAAILPVRTDMIVVASVLTQYIIDVTKTSSIELSTFALKEGLLFSASSR